MSNVVQSMPDTTRNANVKLFDKNSSKKFPTKIKWQMNVNSKLFVVSAATKKILNLYKE